MSETRVKPGPWKMQMSEDSDSYLITDEVNNTVAIVPDGSTANMIEALPELLEALEAIVKEGEDYVNSRTGVSIYWLSHANAAIAKAYGE